MSATSHARFGYRHEIVHNLQGSPFNQDTPLRAEDFLNPQPGDVFNHGELHDQIVDSLRRSLEQHLHTRPNLTLVSRAKVVLPPPAVHHPMPDLVVVENLSEPSRPRAILDMTQETGRVRTLIEVTSPLFAHYDLADKVAIYAAAGIEEYIVLDTGLRPDQPPAQSVPAPTIHAYALDASGRFALQTLHPTPTGGQQIASRAIGASLATTAQGFALIDSATGAPITPNPGEGATLSSTQAEGRFRAQSIASQLKL